MKDNLWNAFQIMLDNWNRMLSSEMDQAEEDADQFEASFYQFIDIFREWFFQREEKPQHIDEVLAITEVKDLIEQVPAPLMINVQTELEIMLEEGLNKR